MRSILCVTQQLLLDGWTDLHETLGVYITRLGLLHGVLFHFRSEPRNRKCGCFRKPEVGTGSWKYSRWKENKILGQKYYSTFLKLWPGEASESSKDFFFSCKSIWVGWIPRNGHILDLYPKQFFSSNLGLKNSMVMLVFSKERAKKVTSGSANGINLEYPF